MEPFIYISIAAIIFCLLGEAFFSGSETAFISCNRIRIRHLSYIGDTRAKKVEEILKKPAKLMATTLVGTNLCVITSSSIATYVCIHFWKEDLGSIIATFAMLPLILLFGEIFPKILFRLHSNHITLSVVRPLQYISYFLYPLVEFASLITHWILNLFNIDEKTNKAFITREEIPFLIEASQNEGIIPKKEQAMIQQIFYLGETKVKKAMIPLIEVIALDIDTPSDEIKETFIKYAYTHIPIYQKRLDNIIGILNFENLLEVDTDDLDLNKLPLNKPYFIPENMSLERLLEEFQTRTINISIVVDEYANIIGIIKLEDVIEEIVGEITDEYEGEQEQLIHIQDDGTYIISGKLEIDKLNEELDLNVSNTDFETVAGLVLELAGKIPSKGERLIYNNRWELEILERDPRSILLVHFKQKQEEE